MIDEPPWPFLMTPRQHRQWARILRSKGKPEKVQRHELLARAIEKIAERQAKIATAIATEPVSTEQD